MAHQRNARRPDWDVWKHHLSARAYEMVALSLNINPENIPGVSTGMFGDLIIGRAPKEFQSRIKIAINHIESDNLKTKNIVPSIPHRTIEMSVFYNWAQKLEWVLPEEFPRQSRSIVSPDPVTRSKVGHPGKYDWEGAICATLIKIFHGEIGGEHESARPQWAKFMSQWLSDRGGPNEGGPTDAEVRKRTKLINEALKKARAGDENP